MMESLLSIMCECSPCTYPCSTSSLCPYVRSLIFPLINITVQERPELDNHLLTHTSDIPSDDSASEDDSLGEGWPSGF